MDDLRKEQLEQEEVFKASGIGGGDYEIWLEREIRIEIKHS